MNIRKEGRQAKDLKELIERRGFSFSTIFLLGTNCSALQEKPRRPINFFKSFTCLPYIHGTTDKIQRVLNAVGVRVAMRPFATIGKSLPSPKDPLDVNEITDIIYQVPCHDCPFVYIGQTKRDLKLRLSEHKRAIKYQRPEKVCSL